jgi:hypothetical protein
MSTSTFIEQLAAGHAADAKETLSNLLSARAFEALDARKQELGATLFGSQVEEEVKLKEEKESEHYKAGHDYASDHAQDSGFKATARARKKEMLADNPHKKGTKEHSDWHRGANDGHQMGLDNM